MRVVSDLDRNNFAGAQCPQRARLVGSAQFLHVAEAAEHPALRIKNRGRTRSPAERGAPGRQQWILGYRHLQQPSFAATLPALFL